MSEETKWAQPMPVNDAEMVFGGGMDRLLPPMSEIPEEFVDSNTRTKWVGFARDWFFRGIATDGLKFKDGIDPNKAMRHLQTIQGSFQPKHEHKEAAVAYLASLWLDESSTWETNKKE